MEATTYRIDLPARFYDDHVSRELPAGTVVKRLAKTVRIDATAADLYELRADADYYSDPYGPGAEDIGLRSSAAATVRRIDKLGVDLLSAAATAPPPPAPAAPAAPRTLGDCRPGAETVIAYNGTTIRGLVGDTIPGTRRNPAPTVELDSPLAGRRSYPASTPLA